LIYWFELQAISNLRHRKLSVYLVWKLLKRHCNVK